jgi:hypothetical protein
MFHGGLTLDDLTPGQFEYVIFSVDIGVVLPGANRLRTAASTRAFGKTDQITNSAFVDVLGTG